MGKDLELDDIKRFKEQYISDKQNREIEKKIKEQGLKKASVEKSKKYKFEFNIEVEDIKIYNQLDSHQCNIYAFLRMVKDVMHKRGLDVDSLDLSANYISFFDKLEKANVLYNELINYEDLNCMTINNLVERYIGSFGTFHFCREIVNKYGLVVAKEMNEVNKTYDDALTIELLKNKIKCDAYELINIKFEEKQKKKKELMYEIYQFLSKIYGNPPVDFKFQGKLMTPLQFKNEYLKNDLDDYITITTFTKEALFASYSYIPNVYLNDNENIKRLSLAKIKEAIIKQLKEGVSVWFSAEESTTLDYNENILDVDLYNFKNLLNIKDISRNKKMELNLVNYDHAMCITGALVENNEVKQFKVDNSFGAHGKYRGQLIMTSSFFDNFVITTIINKKYLE